MKNNILRFLMRAAFKILYLGFLATSAFAYQGGTTRPHNHTSAAGDGGLLSNLKVTGTLDAQVTNGVANVVQYGADPTGAADSSGAFASAIAASSSVYVPCGTYLIAQVGIANKSGFKMQGAGACTILKKNPNTVGGVLAISNSSELTLSDLYVNGNSTTTANLAYNGVGLDGCTHCTLQNLAIYGAEGDGLHMVSVAGPSGHNSFRNVYISSNNAHGINCFNQTQDDDVFDNVRVFSSTTGAANSGEAAQMELTNSRIFGSVFDGNSNIGLTLAGDGTANRADNLLIGNRFFGGTYGLELGSFQDGTMILANSISGANGTSNITAPMKASVGASGRSGQIALIGNSIVTGQQAVFLPQNGSSAWDIVGNQISKSSTTNATSWFLEPFSSATVVGNVMDANNMGTTAFNFVDQIPSFDTFLGNVFLAPTNNATAMNLNGTDDNMCAFNRVEGAQDITTNVNSHGMLILDSTYTLRGLNSISGNNQIRSLNLRGSVTISGTNTSATVTFPQNEPDGSYFVNAVRSSSTGTPATGSNRVWVSGKGTTGFTMNTEVAPGAGNSIIVDWVIIR